MPLRRKQNMKVLLVNKFLYPKGGAETYVFNLGNTLKGHGHEVEYFGLENSANTEGNSIGQYVTDMDFGKGTLKNLTAPFRIIYSAEARRKMKKILYSFEPDVVHLNNIHFHLTPSIILALDSYRRKTGRQVKLVYTAHDYQLVCPSHGLFDCDIQICEKCLGGNYTHCVRTKCMKNSRLKSLLATIEAYYWKHRKAYKCIDTIICPSKFLKSKIDTDPRFAEKTVAIHNFIEPQTKKAAAKGSYVLEFGHLSRDKGTLTLLKAAERMPDTRFVFAGYGEAEPEIAKVKNAEFVGFKTGDELDELIAGALCTVCPSEMYENLPYSVIESQTLGTPVIGADIGGIPELIEEEKTGLVFTPGDADDLEKKLRYFLETPGIISQYSENCRKAIFETPETYCRKIMKIYGE